MRRVMVLIAAQRIIASDTVGAVTPGGCGGRLLASQAREVRLCSVGRYCL
jgi:hypothetical protein